MDSVSYQKGRQHVLAQLEDLRKLHDELKYKEPAFFNGLPVETQQRFLFIDRDISRLRNPNLTVAFVGGFSAGKSSLVNAFLGRYLLPEAVEVTTAVPTFVRSGQAEEHAELHYLAAGEVDAVGELYRKELVALFNVPQLANAPARELIEAIRPMTQEGRGKKLVEYFALFLERRQGRQLDERGRVVTCPLDDMQRFIRDEAEAMFLDRVEVRLRASLMPPDVQLVDLPGVSVPNPRHREVTFRFVTRDAHAVVFVLMAPRLFDADELDIFGKIRAGEAAVAQRTFWVLNRWDSLSSQQRQDTLAIFKAKMSEFGIPDSYLYFTTNALHGLLAQLALRGEQPSDPKLQRHFQEYNDALAPVYGGSHEAALKESRIPELQRQVLAFLNERLRSTVLSAAVANAEQNFCQPLLHHLKAAKERDEGFGGGSVKDKEGAEIRSTTTEHFDRRMEELGNSLRQQRDKVAVERAAMFADEANRLEEVLRAEIQSGDTTDAYAMYKRIIADNPLRRYPYYFEIEMRVVDGLNMLLKRRFLEIVRKQVGDVVKDLLAECHEVLERFKEDVGYDGAFESGVAEVFRGLEQSLLAEVDGVVKERTTHLDELLLYKTPAFFGILGRGNEIIEALERSARTPSHANQDVSAGFREDDMKAQTGQIRKTLEQHYIPKAAAFRKQVADSTFPIVIAQILSLEKNLKDYLREKYRPLLELAKGREVEEKYRQLGQEFDERAKRFRSAMERIQEASQKMRQLP